MPTAQYREARTPVSKGKQLHHIEVMEGEDGGHKVVHHYAEDGMTYHKPKEHFFGDDEGEDMIDHVRKHMHVTTTKEASDKEREKEEV